MAVELLGGLGAFKALYESAKALKDINDATVRNAAVIDLQEKILNAQESQSSLLERVKSLERQIAAFKTWDADKQAYEMTALPSGSVVYALKTDPTRNLPSHYICPKCYEHNRRSILQKKATSIVSAHLSKPPMYVCPECKSEIVA